MAGTSEISGIADITRAMMSDAGIDTGMVELHPTGQWYVMHAPGLHVDFGPGTTETGAAAPGWDVTSYVPRDGWREAERYEFWDTAEEALAYVATMIRTYMSG